MAFFVTMFLGYLLVTRFNIKISIDSAHTKKGENWYDFPTLPMPKLMVLLVIVFALLAPDALPNVINIIHQIPLQ